MSGRRRNAAPGSARRATRSQAQRPNLTQSPSQRSSSRRTVLPGVYRDMLVEAGAGPSQSSEAEPSEPPTKRLRRPGQPSSKPRDGNSVAAAPKPNPSEVIRSASEPDYEDEDEDEDVEFEDVALPAPTIQTTYLDSEDEGEEDEDVVFEDIDFDVLSPRDTGSSDRPSDLELNLTAHRAAMSPRRNAVKRKPISKAEREQRAEIHKMHLCCLLIHAARRNRWCNDTEVQESLLPLLPEKVIRLMKPGDHLSQFGRTESLKDAIQQARAKFKSAFEITERGLRRALWAEEGSHLDNYKLPEDLESTMDKDDFRKAARLLVGSRDVGAQLFCALLRSAGVQTRLVCSLQPLSFLSGVPTLPKPRSNKISSQIKSEAYRAKMSNFDYLKSTTPTEPVATGSPLRRLGHPNATAYAIPDMAPPPKTASYAKEKGPNPMKNESAYPVYWVEVLDESHQKWQPVDPLVTCSQWRPAKLEPPLTDRDNSLTYAIAFASDGTARDVTRRYAKAYTSKTRKLRVDNLPIPILSDPAAPSGEEWYALALSFFRRPLGIVTDLDRIEETELAAATAREPMPRNVADFKDHPLYALERHLRRNEVLAPGARSSGTVAAGSKGPLERIYRRRDVRVAWSADRWYRMGRVVRPNEIPAKFLPKRRRPRGRGRGGGGFSDDGEGEEEDPVLGPGDTVGTPIFTRDQTDLYVPDPVVDGVVPRNRFHNVDVFVPSMVPPGGAHVPHDKACRAAFLLGVDYAPALTGFEFKGRQGTAVLRGCVVASEYEEAVLAVARGLDDVEAEAEEERKARRALRLWSRFLKVLRIDERIWAAADGAGGTTAQSMLAPRDAAKTKGKVKEKERSEDLPSEDEDVAEDQYTDGGDESQDHEDDDVDNEGGGFVVDNDDDDDHMGGGFLVE